MLDLAFGLCDTYVSKSDVVHGYIYTHSYFFLLFVQLASKHILIPKWLVRAKTTV